MRNGWKATKIGAICEVLAGQSPEGEFYNESGEGLPFYQGKKEFQDRFIGKPKIWTRKITKVALAGDILLSVRAPVGPVNFATEKSCIGRGLAAIRASEKVDRDFLFYFLLSQESEIRGTEGAVFASLSKGQIEEISVPFPALSEQKRIVAILDEAFEGIGSAIANTGKNLANSRELYESHLNSIFSHNHEGWVERPLSTLIEIKHGFAFKSEYFTNEGRYVLLTPGNFYEEGGYRDRREKQKFYVGEIPAGYILDQGDFLIAMTEQAAGLLGSSIIVPEDDRFLHNQRLGLVSVKPGVFWWNQFFFHAFRTKSFRKAVHDGASGVKVRHTSPNKLGLVKVRYPLSISEQEQVAGGLDRLLLESKRLGGIYEAKLYQLAELKQAVLRKAFAGELTAHPEKALPEAAE